LSQKLASHDHDSNLLGIALKTRPPGLQISLSPLIGIHLLNRKILPARVFRLQVLQLPINLAALPLARTFRIFLLGIRRFPLLTFLDEADLLIECHSVGDRVQEHPDGLALPTRIR